MTWKITFLNNELTSGLTGIQINMIQTCTHRNNQLDSLGQSLHSILIHLLQNIHHHNILLLLHIRIDNQMVCLDKLHRSKVKNKLVIEGSSVSQIYSIHKETLTA